MKKYDIVIPLGEMCATAIALRDSGIRCASYPFDWSAGVKYEICGNSGLPGKIKMICDDFKDAFRLEDLSEFWTAQSKHRSVLNNRTGLQYLHDFVWEKPVVDQFPEYLEKYQRRIQRFYKDIEQSNTILFVFVTRSKHFLSFYEINSALDMLNKKFPNKDINFLLVQDSYDCNPNEFKFIKISDHMDLCLYKDDPALGDGNQPVLKRVFSQFIQGVDEYNFATDNVKNYGLSVKESWGRWSDGNDVWLDVPVCFDGDVEIDFDIWPYLVDQHTTQDVDVYLENKKIASWHFEKDMEKPETKLKIQKNKIKNNSVLLHFVIKNPVSLAELGLGENTRKLGIGFKKMNITAVV